MVGRIAPLLKAPARQIQRSALSGALTHSAVGLVGYSYPILKTASVVVSGRPDGSFSPRMPSLFLSASDYASGVMVKRARAACRASTKAWP
ncbi:hypothetical protein XFF6166_220002 [Xanthomonas citri pv. fuscans]|nr:hypothetical protein XFF6166_220002 [Xanthomonas citri pv. fuscans]SOO14753.1 hypothetical protein XFF7766_360026 [Xanthomonas citri pv. fuscans]SOO42549.1 hypothetical protein XFF1815_210026 [Xanthomonas citri pv. fuscans]